MANIKGYVPPSPHAMIVVNQHKELEERVLRTIDVAGVNPVVLADPRWLAVARTHIEQGFMALNRAVFKPTRIKLPEDPA